MSIEAMKLALEALEEVQMAITTTPWMNRRIEDLRAAIEQAEKQEPVAWFMEGTYDDGTPSFVQVNGETDPEFYVPLYTAPPQREWHGLTDEEHEQIAIDCGCASADWVFYGAAVERKVKEKNT
jgi:hypothetical protein